MADKTQQIQFERSDGTLYNLHLPPSRHAYNMTGWGKPPTNLNVTAGPYQHGESVISYKLLPRRIEMTLIHKYCNQSEYLQGRSELLSQMGNNSNKATLPEPGKLIWNTVQNGAITKRQVDAYLESGFAFDVLTGWRSFTVQEELTFLAPDPVIYDPTVITVNDGAYTDALVLPATFPIVFGSDFYSTNVTYQGTWPSYPIFTIDGPTSGFYAENVTTGKAIHFNYTVSLGETVTLTLSPLAPTAVNNFGVDLISKITENSDIVNFQLYPAPMVAGGINTMKFIVSSAATGTDVTMTYYNRYYGI